MCFADLAYKKVAIALEGLQCGFCTARYVANQLYLKFENGNQIHVWYGNKGNLNSFKLLVWPDDADANLVREKLHCVEGAMPPADGHYWRFAAYWEVSNQLGLIGFNGLSVRHHPHETCVRARRSAYPRMRGQGQSWKQKGKSDQAVLIFSHVPGEPSKITYEAGPSATVAKLKDLLVSCRACRNPPSGTRSCSSGRPQAGDDEGIGLPEDCTKFRIPDGGRCVHPVGKRQDGDDDDDGISMGDLFDICSPDGVSPGYLNEGMYITREGFITEDPVFPDPNKPDIERFRRRRPSK